MTTQLLVLGELEPAKQLAQNFLQEQTEKFNEVLDVPEYGITADMQQRLLDGGLMLRHLQRQCIKAMDDLRYLFEDDDLVEQLSAGKEQDLFRAVVDLVSWFELINPDKVVVSVIPIDFTGTVGFVVQPRQ